MDNRIKKIQALLKVNDCESLFISNQNNVTYLTGFNGLSAGEREGFLFITPVSAYLLTFPTYYGMYKYGGDNFKTLCITSAKRLHQHLSEIVKRENLATAGFEKENVTVAELESLTQKISLIFKPTSGIVEKFREIKEAEEIKYVKKAAGLTDDTFKIILTKIKTGVSEKELAFEIEFFIKKNGGELAFPPIVAFDKNAAVPHYLPSSVPRLSSGNLILLDFGARIDNYCSDMTRVVFLGTPSVTYEKMYRTTLEAQELALTSLKIGSVASGPDNLAQEYITSKGFPKYPHGLGHGVGLAIHENPRLRFDSPEILKENMVVTAEPGIYLEDIGGVRIEDLVLLKKSGPEILSKSPKNLIIL